MTTKEMDEMEQKFNELLDERECLLLQIKELRERENTKESPQCLNVRSLFFFLQGFGCFAVTLNMNFFC